MYSLADIIELVKDKTGSDGVTPNVDIESGLGCSGDDWDELILEYANRYNVDMGSYLWYFHTDEEGHSNSIGRAFFKAPYERITRIPISPQMLLDFANKGKWDISYLKSRHAEQAFVTDITYLKTDQGHAYLALVTDVFSKQIMGWSLDDNMKVSMVKEALTMANESRIYKHENIIHHSDRGRQYCCPEYVEFAKEMGFVMSTTQQSDPYENAVAERINGTLKYEFGFRKTLPNIEVARKMMKQAAEIYNKERLHWSLNLKTPEQVHRQYNQHKHKSYATKDKGKKVTFNSSCEDGNELCRGATRIVPKP